MGEKWARLTSRHREELVDVLVAVALLAYTVPPVLMGQIRSSLHPSPWVAVLAAVAASLVMLVRRRWAWPTLVLAVACYALTGAVLPLIVATYSMTAHFTVRRWRPVATLMAAVFLVIDYAITQPAALLFVSTVRGLLLVYLPAVLGDWVLGYRAMIRSLQETVRIREENAALQERRRIARELHDTVTHAVTTMVLNAGIMQDTDDPAELPNLAKNIEDQGIRALTELRELLTMLHRTEIPPSAKGIDAIPQLVQDINATGLEVALELDIPKEPLPRRVEHAAYRVVQEGLNNVRKHALGARARVAIHLYGKVITVSVVNTAPSGSVRRGPTPALESGYGLAGLRERIKLAGGWLTAGPAADGGYAITAQLPCRPSDEGP